MRRCSLLLAWFLVIGNVMSAQAAGRFLGRVTSDIGEPVPYVRVTWGALCPAGVTPGHTFTDANGYWSSPTLGVTGRYSVTAGPGPCTKNVYLCGTDNTKTVISTSDVSDVDFRRDLITVSGVAGANGAVRVIIGSSADRPTIPDFRGSFTQAAPCGDTLAVYAVPDPGYVVGGLLVDGIAPNSWGYQWNNNKLNHTVSVTFTPYVEPPGACCKYNPDSCTLTNQVACLASGGYFLGIGTECFYACYPVNTKHSSWGRLKTIYR